MFFVICQEYHYQNYMVIKCKYESEVKYTIQFSNKKTAPTDGNRRERLL